MVDLTGNANYGPAMAALNERQRAFVLNLLAQTGKKSNTRAAKAAGYAANSQGSLRVHAHLLAHDPKVLTAMLEETRARLDASAIIGADALITIANDPKISVKDRRAAAVAILDRTGFGPQQNINVNKTVLDLSGAAMLGRIKALAAKHGIDPTALLGGNAASIEGEFKVVPNAE